MRLPRRLYPQEMLKLQATAHAAAAPQPWPYGEEPSVTVAVVTFDRLALTRRCLASLFATRPEYPFELLIVDNGSASETVAYLQEIEAQQPGVRILFQQTNLGCGQARNLAFHLRHAATDDVRDRIDVQPVVMDVAHRRHGLAKHQTVRADIAKPAKQDRQSA